MYLSGFAFGEKHKEEEVWHDEQITTKMIIKEKIDQYVQSFTVHGLTKVCVGTRLESLFWLIMLLGGILSSVVVIHGLVSKYLNYGVYTEIRLQVTDKNFFPSVSFCENRLLINSYFSYCANPPGHKVQNTSAYCTLERILTNNNISTVKDRYWTNGIFNVTKCQTWGGKLCANDRFFKSLTDFNNSCITWNYNGDLHDIYSHVELEFEFYPPSVLQQPGLENNTQIIAVPHDPEDHEIDITKRVDLEPFKGYEIKLDKTIIKRLPYPYPSNCTSLKEGDIFPGKYTRRSCIESHNYIEMYKKCGDTLDYIKQFIPEHIKRQYRQNNTITDAENCIWEFGRGETKRSTLCAFPCQDLDLGVISTFNERNVEKYRGNILKFRVSLQYQGVDSYKVMEEKELYSWDQMACEMGGLIGLVIGASVISLVEILAYIFLVIMQKLL